MKSNPRAVIQFLLLLVASRKLDFIHAQYSDTTCHTDPQKILEAELELNAVSITKERTYYICKNTFMDIQNYDWYTKTYGKTGVRPLIFVYPNARILCGPDGDLGNNCTLQGGTLQLEVVDPSFFGKATSKIKNVIVQGFTFTGLGSQPESANIYIFGTKQGAELTVKNCNFVNNVAVSNIKFDDNFKSSVTVDSCSFNNNTLVNSKSSRNSGLIFTDLGGTINVKNSIFMDNTVNTTYPDDWYGLNAAVTAIDSQGMIEVTSVVDVQNSCFVRNRGVTSSLVLGALWGDGAMTQKNNFVMDNVYVQDKFECAGVGKLFMNFYYFYYGYYNFTTGICQEKFTASSCAPMPSLSLPNKDKETVLGTPKSSSSSKNVIAAVIIPLLLILFGAGAFLWYRKRRRSNSLGRVSRV